MTGVRFKLDENVPRAVQLFLAEHGYDVETVLSEDLGGASDAYVLSACAAERRVLITLDLDFADIRSYPPASHHGIWVLRPALQTFQQVVDLVASGARMIDAEQPAGQLWVIESGIIRIRH